MNQSKKSIYTAITGVIYIFINGLLGIIVLKVIIEKYGSDFNGLNSTATQLTNILLLLEGGLTIATNVALLKPYNSNNVNDINRILSEAKILFKKIGISVLLIGTIISLVYSIFLKSSFNIFIIFLLFLMTLFPVVINLYQVVKYRLILQMEQKEYIINIINIITITLSHLMSIMISLLMLNVLLIRFNIMFFSLINSVIIVLYTKRKFSYNLNIEIKEKKIKGTRDLFLQKITSAMYTGLPLILITLVIGTDKASVYVVYNSIFMLIKGILIVILSAPKIALGNFLIKSDKDCSFHIFKIYEFIAINLISIFTLTTSITIIPFIELYTKNIPNAEYIDYRIAILMVLITIIEIIHIPSGILLNITGQFKITRNIQFIGAFVLIFSLIFNLYLFELYGILISVLITALTLATLEIYVVHKKYFKKKLYDFIVIFISNIIISLFIFYIGNRFYPIVFGWIDFIVFTIILFITITVILLIWNFIFFKEMTIGLIKKILNILLEKKR